MSIRKKQGRKPRLEYNNKPLLNELLNNGYTINNICDELQISKKTYLVYFSNPEEFKFKHFRIISYLLNKKLSDVFNITFNYNSNAPQWVNNSVNATILKQVNKVDK